jgi:Spy/CpxP family protein refolding chaperone
MFRQITLLALFAAPLAAQQPPAPAPRPRAPAMAPEDLLRMKTLLDLNTDQVTKLQALRKETVEARRAEMGRMLELRSQIRAGDLAREDARKAMLDQRTEARKQIEARQTQLNAVLTDKQREKLQTLHQEMRLHRGVGGGRPGRGGAWQQRRGDRDGWVPLPGGRGQWRRQPAPPPV